MVKGWLERYRVLILIFLIVVIVIGAVFLFYRLPGSKKPLEIVLTTPTPSLSSGLDVYVGGAVLSPGWYLLDGGDSLNEAIMAAGGATTDADLARIKLYLFESGDSVEPQKIDINRAQAWLLEALPGIGPTLAQRIVDYRNQNGPFGSIGDLKRVDGIGEQTYERLKDLITAQ